MISNKNSFKVVGGFIVNRLCTPLSHVSFWSYFFLAIILFGPAGVWVELFRLLKSNSGELDGLLTAIYTYFPAIVAGAGAQLIMDGPPKPVSSFVMVWIAISFVLVMPHFTGLIKPTNSLYIGCLGTAMAFFLWWVANGENPSYLDSHPSDALGAAPSSEPAGDASNFTV